jgi:hypothetical protein
VPQKKGDEGFEYKNYEKGVSRKTLNLQNYCVHPPKLRGNYEG